MGWLIYSVCPRQQLIKWDPPIEAPITFELEGLHTEDRTVQHNPIRGMQTFQWQGQGGFLQLVKVSLAVEEVTGLTEMWWVENTNHRDCQ